MINQGTNRMPFVVLCTVMALLLPWSAQSTEQQPDSAKLVRDIVDAPAEKLTFTQAKLAVDKFIDPALNEGEVRSEIDEMVVTVRKMLSTLPQEAAATDMEKMKALRAFIYEPGQWNDGEPFQYDLSDPFGQQPGAQQLSHYLKTKKGNCVSMPILFIVLGERLGLDLTLSTAPLHVFVKFTDRATGQTWNLETTSGAGFTRDSHYRKIMPMTDEAIANGIYLKKLSRQEALSVIATGILDNLLAAQRYDDAIAVADVLIEANPADAYAMAKKGTAYYRLLDREFISKYPKESDIPAGMLPRALELQRANQAAFAKAEALGWREPDLN
ncbi:transglutaminase family protein [Mesorhizobium sp. 1M-11]|uniref:transglutaminase family protein n=1 Tax=Mesorhizobium sp. 1M-11 TaxID=1529006 RepID=UPI0006C73926|nr:transglutaminase family protein [Mesorhizobium sp. 1M-11]